MLLEVVKYPAKALAGAKKKGEQHTIKLLLINSLLIAAAFGLFLVRFSSLSTTFANIALIAASTGFLLSIILSVFFAYILQIVVNTLGGNGKYMDGLAAMVYSLTALALGLFVSSLLLFIPSLGPVIALLILSVTSALSMATLYRAIKELFRTDMIVAFVSVSVLILSVVIAVYGTGVLAVANMFMMGV